MKLNFQKITKTALILVYLVIVAGALVRMTGSGMGCPDWPRCFGYYIPPTDIKELMWSPNHEFRKGQVIIHDENLLVANKTFTTGKSFDPAQWDEYTKHDYAEFNAVHTWIEYINRLVGAVAGLGVLIMAIASFSYRKTKVHVTLWSWLAVFMMGFQGWLGATVVYSVLNPVKITIHMVVALLIVGLILLILDRVKDHNDETPRFKHDKLFGRLLVVSIFLTLIQVVLGTQVREFVDERVKLLGYGNMGMVLDNPIFSFYFHRTFSFLVAGINLWLFVRNRKLKLGYKKTSWVMWLLASEVVSGITMYYLDFPFGSQAAHMVTAAMLFGVQFYMILESRRNAKVILNS